MIYQVIKYEEKYKRLWNDLILRSSNGTFLHHRDYMEYHASRFNDFSLMVFEDKKLRAVFPLHIENQQAYAHNGLTYGDLIFQKKLKLEHKIEIFHQVLSFLHQQQITDLSVKNIPFIFHQQIDQTSDYIYFQLKANIELVKPFFVLIKNNAYKINRNRLKNIKKLSKESYQICNSSKHLKEFWKIVEDNLMKRHGTKPVHNFDEIKLLMERFPKQIQLFSLQKDGQVLAGALVYYINKAFHFQYIHTVEDNRERKAVEWLVYQVIEQHKHYDYISFGSSQVDGNNLNKGLVYWKESWGSNLINQYYYRVKTANFPLLKKILV